MLKGADMVIFSPNLGVVTVKFNTSVLSHFTSFCSIEFYLLETCEGVLVRFAPGAFLI